MHSLKRTLGAPALAVLGFLTMATAPADAATPARTARAAPPPVSCGWPAVVRPSRLNFAFPETNATYWMMPYRLAAGERLTVQGTYPAARFTSLTSYDLKGAPVDSLADRQISPAPGSRNPFAEAHAGTDAARHRYSVTVKPGVPAGPGGNTMAATTGSAASGSGFLVLRIYVPDNAADPTGGVPLPALSVRHKDGSTSSVGTCAGAGSAKGSAGPLAGFLRQRVQEDAAAGGFEGCGRSTAKSPGFALPDKTAGYFPNPYNKYLCTPVGHEPGRIAVIRGKAPTFPHTSDGQSVLTRTQVRYWSLCQNQWRLPYPATSCAGDFQTALDKDGRYTIVVSDPKDRPANATTENRVTWIPWGPTDVTGILLFRTMLPAKDFDGAVQNVREGQNPAKAMGDYFPVISYCTKDLFAKGGTGACAATAEVGHSG
ncbi:DUF1214 domain-containing protein [Streptomyces sp. NBC_00820]|uniref:hypothetical protein n=1 Tax=Streptomyces sp. NBC_00820 TaxID=2975842 RepID=UPI002ED6237C|nr:DUF1214 domain-containing protein [Streptomyces sp. NBC_00820]